MAEGEAQNLALIRFERLDHRRRYRIDDGDRPIAINSMLPLSVETIRFASIDSEEPTKPTNERKRVVALA